MEADLLILRRSQLEFNQLSRPFLQCWLLLNNDRNTITLCQNFYTLASAGTAFLSVYNFELPGSEVTLSALHFFEGPFTRNTVHVIVSIVAFF